MSSALPVCSAFLGDASDWRRRKAGLLTLLLIGEVRVRPSVGVHPWVRSDNADSWTKGDVMYASRDRYILCIVLLSVRKHPSVRRDSSVGARPSVCPDRAETLDLG